MLGNKRFQGTKAWKKFYQYSANKDYELFSEQLKLILTKQVTGIAESADVIYQWLCIIKPST
jgi:hypothetical protein